VSVPNTAGRGGLVTCTGTRGSRVRMSREARRDTSLSHEPGTELTAQALPAAGADYAPPSPPGPEGVRGSFSTAAWMENRPEPGRDTGRPFFSRERPVSPRDPDGLAKPTHFARQGCIDGPCTISYPRRTRRFAGTKFLPALSTATGEYLMSRSRLSSSIGSDASVRIAWDRRARSASDVLIRDGDFNLKRTDHDPTGHLAVLEALDGAGHISQRRLAETVGMATSRVNRIIRSLQDGGLVRVVDEMVRPYAYRVTAEGRAYLQELSYEHYAAVVGRFRQVERRIGRRLAELRDEGLERVVCYGAGEVMELVRPLAESHGLRVVGVVDDDPEKQGRWGAVDVASPDSIGATDADAVVITTFRRAGEIRARLAVGATSALRVVDL
jgi:DNA-binding MarR family transcriptional regulator